MNQTNYRDHAIKVNIKFFIFEYRIDSHKSRFHTQTHNANTFVASAYIIKSIPSRVHSNSKHRRVFSAGTLSGLINVRAKPRLPYFAKKAEQPWPLKFPYNLGIGGFVPRKSFTSNPMLTLKFEQHPNLCERVTRLLFMTFVLCFLYLYTIIVHIIVSLSLLFT